MGAGDVCMIALQGVLIRFRVGVLFQRCRRCRVRVEAIAIGSRSWPASAWPFESAEEGHPCCCAGRPIVVRWSTRRPRRRESWACDRQPQRRRGHASPEHASAGRLASWSPTMSCGALMTKPASSAKRRRIEAINGIMLLRSRWFAPDLCHRPNMRCWTLSVYPFPSACPSNDRAPAHCDHG